MFLETDIKGKYVVLKSATAEDADFTRNIRRDPDFSAFFPFLNNTIEQQIDWIEYQRCKADDYFFVVWNNNGNRIGTIGLYDFNDKCCESGRLAIKGNAFECIEAQLLIFQFAFNNLKMDTVLGFIFADNERAIRFNKQFGCVLEEPIMHSNGHLMIKATYSKENVAIAIEKLNRMLYR